MNIRKVAPLIGTLLMIIGGAMLLPLAWALYYKEAIWYIYPVSSAITLFCGALLFVSSPRDIRLNAKEAIFLVSCGWLLASLFGVLPYLLSGSFVSFADAFYESVSGFTTTGTSVFADIEHLRPSLIFWRSLTNWLGGMGIIVLFVALLSSVGVGGFHLLRAEVPGHNVTKLTPRISRTAMILWLTYLSLTVGLALILLLLGFNLFDALCHAFSTIATSGSYSENVGAGYANSDLIHWVLALFMFMSGTNFALYFIALKQKSIRAFWKNSEFRFYSMITAAAILLSTFIVWSTSGQSIAKVFSETSFMIVSFITTTGYSTVEYTNWPIAAQAILLLLMFVGGSTGSTGGSLKVARIQILISQVRLELQRAIHPNAIKAIRIDNSNISSENLISVQQFFFTFLFFIVGGTLAMLAQGMDLLGAFSIAIASLSNTGAVFGGFAGSGSFAEISASGKYILSFLMIIGRLEIFTFLVLFAPTFWKK